MVNMQPGIRYCTSCEKGRQLHDDFWQKIAEERAKAEARVKDMEDEHD